jgi:hypothetical protein
MKLFLKLFGICFISIPILLGIIWLISPSLGYWISFVLYLYYPLELVSYFLGGEKSQLSTIGLILVITIPHILYSSLLSAIIYGLNMFKNMEN